jgi:hypothetical protein
VGASATAAETRVTVLSPHSHAALPAMKDAGFLFALALVAAARAAAAYTWPNPQMEALDALHYEQTGQAGAQSAQFVFPCNPTGFLGVGGSNSGRINAADWLRTVRHACVARRVGPTDPLTGLSRHGYSQRYGWHGEPRRLRSTFGSLYSCQGGLDASIQFADEQNRPEVAQHIPLLPRVDTVAPEHR